MRIYIAGPYSSPNHFDRDANVGRADDAARMLTRMGHTPYCPHKMTWRWEEDPLLVYEDFLRIDLDWVSSCHALLYLAPSPGADRELAQAEELGLVIFRSLAEIPNLLPERE